MHCTLHEPNTLHLGTGLLWFGWFGFNITPCTNPIPYIWAPVSCGLGGLALTRAPRWAPTPSPRMPPSTPRSLDPQLQGLELKVQGLELKLQGLELKVQGVELKGHGLELKVQGTWFNGSRSGV